MRLKLLTPRGARIREKDIDVVSRLAHFCYKSIELLYFGVVCGDSDGVSIGPLIGESIECCDSFIACRSFSGCDVDFRATGLEKTGYC